MIREFIFAALLLIIITLLVTLLSGAIAASPDCLTYQEARQQWPRHHLYWHTANHCWNNYRRHYFRPVRKPFTAPAMLARAKETEKIKEEKQPEDRCCWPKLERDKDGKIIEPPRNFEDRWNDQAWTRSLK